jgi:hypothetical protein
VSRSTRTSTTSTASWANGWPVIDFDEARLGNPTFDLARGPYSPLPAALVEGARHGYTTLARAPGAPGGDDVKGGSL